MMQKCGKLESAFVSDRELAATCLQKQVKSGLHLDLDLDLDLNLDLDLDGIYNLHR